ncbi:MAG: hypothetical protein M3Q03_17125 [Chloroflexota bacterium]|nr:hypothetical protein [Chloroflexota bacterium]
MEENGVPVWGIRTGRPRGATKETHRVLEQEMDSLFKRGYIALGWPQVGNLDELPNDREAFRERVRGGHQGEASSATVGADAGMLFRFVHEMQTGDLVVYHSRVDGRIHIGRVAGPYIFAPNMNEDYPALRRVEWLVARPKTDFSDEARRALKARSSLAQVRTGVDEFRAAARTP